MSTRDPVAVQLPASRGFISASDTVGFTPLNRRLLKNAGHSLGNASPKHWLTSGRFEVVKTVAIWSPTPATKTMSPGPPSPPGPSVFWIVAYGQPRGDVPFTSNGGSSGYPRIGSARNSP